MAKNLICLCGCGRTIIEKPSHKFRVPKYIPGHNPSNLEGFEKLRKFRMGKTYEEIYGIEKAKTIKERLQEAYKLGFKDGLEACKPNRKLQKAMKRGTEI